MLQSSFHYLSLADLVFLLPINLKTTKRKTMIMEPE